MIGIDPTQLHGAARFTFEQGNKFPLCCEQRVLIDIPKAIDREEDVFDAFCDFSLFTLPPDLLARADRIAGEIYDLTFVSRFINRDAEGDERIRAFGIP